VELDALTIAVLIGSLYGPVAAWRAAERPAQPWGEVSTGIQALVIAALVGTVAAAVALAAIGRPLLAALLAASSLVSYWLARTRRHHKS